MSSAANAAGYLYASGRFPGRMAREQQQSVAKPEKPARPALRVVVRNAPVQATHAAPRAVKIEYRTRRRWTMA